MQWPASVAANCTRRSQTVERVEEPGNRLLNWEGSGNLGRLVRALPVSQRRSSGTWIELCFASWYLSIETVWSTLSLQEYPDYATRFEALSSATRRGAIPRDAQE